MPTIDAMKSMLATPPDHRSPARATPRVLRGGTTGRASGIIFCNALVLYTQWKTYHTRTGCHEGGHAMRGAFTLRGASIRGAPIESLFFIRMFWASFSSSCR